MTALQSRLDDDLLSKYLHPPGEDSAYIRSDSHRQRIRVSKILHTPRRKGAQHFRTEQRWQAWRARRFQLDPYHSSASDHHLWLFHSSAEMA